LFDVAVSLLLPPPPLPALIKLIVFDDELPIVEPLDVKCCWTGVELELPEHGLPSFTSTGTATRRGELDDWGKREKGDFVSLCVFDVACFRATHLVVLILLGHRLLLRLSLALVAVILKPDFHLKAQTKRIRQVKLKDQLRVRLISRARIDFKGAPTQADESNNQFPAHRRNASARLPTKQWLTSSRKPKAWKRKQNSNFGSLCAALRVSTTKRSLSRLITRSRLSLMKRREKCFEFPSRKTRSEGDDRAIVLD
jgi:hypothetical protein